MKMENAINKLVEASTNENTKPDQLARLCALLINKLTDQSPVGDEALKLLQTKLDAIIRSKSRQERRLLDDEIMIATRRMGQIPATAPSEYEEEKE